MNAFVIDSPSSYGSVDMLRILANSGINFEKAILNVESQPTDSENSEDWPLIFECYSELSRDAKFQVRIHMVTCGYSGTGPHDLIECLKITGFNPFISVNEIFTNKHIQETFVK